MRNLKALPANGAKRLPLIFGLIFLCVGATPSGDFEKAEWLVGTWENKTPRGSVYETWNKAGDTALTGKSYRVAEKDTMVFETLRIVREKDGLVYIPTVKNQNSGLPVRFTATQVTASGLVFENPEHDFPQLISYTRVGADSLVAEISGIRNGRERKQVFPMKRME
ncbi:MAG: DUF6265 family protein [Leadbetterella sp.]|nr:DUF6265 family protein [Leadbetterella sp.]